MNRTAVARWALQSVFVLSGAAALIYQSVWSHYLGLTLGHAAYAQTLVLMMLMGGMALGAWGVSRVTQRLRRPVAVYAVAEALIGVMGLVFHAVFVAYSAYSQQTVLPSLATAHAASAWQWLSAAALIAPQTVLLGATFPLIAAGVLRLDAQRQGQTLGALYFTNGIGAALGALVATFVLLPRLGMPGALSVAGWLNLAVAAASVALSVGLRESRATPPDATPRAPDAPVPGRLLPALLAATFLSSAASFAYELGWVRMLNQALGSSLHSFELMLAAFIAGLALGGLWVRRVGDLIADLVRYAGYVQVLMGLCAIASVWLLGQAYYWVPAILKALARTESGYLLYNAATAGIAILIMAPAAFFAGMTLPLFTAALLRRGAGERAIGQVYSCNTLGAILGVLIAAHVLMPAIGVSLTLLLAGGLDLLIGLVMLRVLSPARWAPGVVATGLAGALLMGVVLHWGLPDRLLQSAGVFRYGSTNMSGRELTYYRDGATATVSVVQQGHQRVLATNGKPDASLTALSDAPTPDEITMVMLGALPLAAHPKPEDIAVIGWGSGVTTHTLVGSPVPKRVDSIEIERAMWEGAATLGTRNLRAYLDARSQVHFEDAREFFARGQQRYDVIVSEPSNPWVSGVASLFTQEFYQGVRRSLKPGGLLVQWVHSYEISDALLAEMIAALQQEFPDSVLYAASESDLIVIAPTAPLGPLSSAPWASEGLAAELRRVGLASVADLAVRRVGGPAVLRTYVRQQGAKPHSDFFPTVSLFAPQQRFQGSQASQLIRLASSGLPLFPVLDCQKVWPASEPVVFSQAQPVLLARQNALWAAERFAGQVAGHPPGAPLASLVDAFALQRELRRPADPVATMLYAANLAQSTLAHLTPQAQQPFWDTASWRRAQPGLPDGATTLLALYEATAQQRWADVARLAERLLDGQVEPSPEGFREHVLVLSMLAGLAQGEPGAVAQREQRWGAKVPAGSQAEARAFLKTWEGAGEPVCAARALSRPPTSATGPAPAPIRRPAP